MSVVSCQLQLQLQLQRTKNQEPMTKEDPNVIVVAGPNGAGKSTAAPSLLQDLLDVSEFVNADVIAQSQREYGHEH